VPGAVPHERSEVGIDGELRVAAAADARGCCSHILDKEAAGASIEPGPARV